MSQISDLIKDARQTALRMTTVQPRHPAQDVRLIEAARDQNIFTVLRLLESGVAINCRDAEDQTALIVACRMGHVSIVRALLDAGAETFHKDDHGWAAYEAAMYNGDYKGMTLPPWDEIGVLLQPDNHVTHDQQMEIWWHREPGETPEKYIERVGGLSSSEQKMWNSLQYEFGLTEGEARSIEQAMKDRFLRQELKERHARGAARYGAINYVRRRSDLSTEEIEELVDSFGKWKK